VPSLLPEALVELFRNRPELAAELLREALGVALPAHGVARIEDSTLTQLVPAQYHADLVVVLGDPYPVLGIVVEVQLDRDEDKRYAWPLYAAAVRARIRAPCLVLVVAWNRGVAAWAARPIEMGQPGCTFVPLVLGPSAVPVVSDPAAARRSPELAVLSALAHGRGDAALPVALAALGAMVKLDSERSRLYHDLVVGALATSARHALEKLMQSGKYEYQTEFARRYVAEGLVQGMARALLAFLAAHGLVVDDAQRARVLACQDTALLDRWIMRAATATSAADVLVDPESGSGGKAR
jgi:hypothetical protein